MVCAGSAWTAGTPRTPSEPAWHHTGSAATVRRDGALALVRARGGRDRPGLAPRGRAGDARDAALEPPRARGRGPGGVRALLPPAARSLVRHRRRRPAGLRALPGPLA